MKLLLKILKDYDNYKKGYFVIIPDKSENKIFVEYYTNGGELLHTIIGNDASSIYYTIITDFHN